MGKDWFTRNKAPVSQGKAANFIDDSLKVGEFMYILIINSYITV